MRGRALLFAFLAMPAMSNLSCGIQRDNAGVCHGDLDPEGQIYYIQVRNFVKQRVRVFVDGRQVGSVGAYDGDSHTFGFQDFGHFAQCSDTKIGFGGTDAIFLSDIQWTLEAMQLAEDRCAVEIWLLDSEDYYASLEDESYLPEDWLEYDKRYPSSYAAVTDRPPCPAWYYYFRVNDNPASGTPTPTEAIHHFPGGDDE